jgi:tRNA(Ile)-lysidine synthase
MKYVVAVSGGVDSVVLLDMLVRAGGHELTVAHFDHGIRHDSAADARFVEGLCKQHGLSFEHRREELGADASEAKARERRYAFLNSVAERHKASIVTAHHADDVIETIAINLTRGTGWRGLAVLNDHRIERPLLGMTKHDVYEYAVCNSLEWVEDETNASEKYLRNRLRKRIAGAAIDTTRLLGLRTRQIELVGVIDAEIEELTTRYRKDLRYFLTMIDETSAVEVLRHVMMHDYESLTRPQLEKLLHMVKTAKVGTVHQPGGKSSVRFERNRLIVNHHR